MGLLKSCIKIITPFAVKLGFWGTIVVVGPAAAASTAITTLGVGPSIFGFIFINLGGVDFVMMLI